MTDSPNPPLRKSNNPKISRNMKTKKLTPLEDAPTTQLSTTMNATKSITHKKDLMEALRRTNPAGVNTAPQIFWDVEGALRTTTIDDSEVQQQMAIVENGVNYNVKRYNDLRVMIERKTGELKAKLDELDLQKKQFEQLDAMKKAETAEAMRIEQLQKESRECDLQIRDKQHYIRRLEHMLGRLKSNQLKFDAHMTGMEETMRNIEKDGAEIRLMRRGLDAGLAKAQLVLEETKSNLAISRKDREVLLEQRKGEFRNALILNDWLKEREKMKVELGIELRGDLTIEEENFLRSQITEKQEKTRNLQRASEEGQKKLQSMEEAFTKLKQVTGVKNVEEMHEKFSNQKSNKLQLELECKDAEHRLAAAKKAHQKQEALFQELKSSGSGHTELNRESINKLEEAFADARNDQKFIKADSERISQVLLGLHQGAQGLLQRVQPYHALAEGGVFELTQIGEESSPWTETVDALTTAEHVLTKMLEAISGDGGGSGPGANAFDDDEDNESTFSRDSYTLDTTDEAPNYHNNVRIKSKKFIRDADAEEEAAMGAIAEKEEDDDVNAVVGANLATVTTLAADTMLSPMHGETVGVGAVTTGVEEKAAVAHTTLGGLAGNNKVPSRVAVKKASAQMNMEAKRKQDMEARRKRLLERMENKGGGDGQDDSRIGQTAKLKAQKASAERLCVTAKPPTLPDGVTLRDDPMTKTIAFLNSRPKLT